MTDSQIVQCPHCGTSLTLKSRKLLGKKARCQSCARVITLENLALQNMDGKLDDEALISDSTPLFDDSGLPKKRSKKKKPPQAELEPAPGFFRNEEGELTVFARFLMMSCLGLAFGILVVLLWSGLIWLTGLRLSFLAILVGIAVGYGVKQGVGDRNLALAPALLSGSIAAMILTTGQLVATEVHNRKYLAEFTALRERVLPVILSEEAFKRRLADDVISHRLKQEIKIDWTGVDEGLKSASEEELLDHPDLYEQLYPADVWGEAEQRFDAYSEADRDRLRDEIRSQWNTGPEALDARTRDYLDLLKTSPRRLDWNDVYYFLAAATLAFVIAKPARKAKRFI